MFSLRRYKTGSSFFVRSPTKSETKQAKSRDFIYWRVSHQSMMMKGVGWKGVGGYLKVVDE